MKDGTSLTFPGHAALKSYAKRVMADGRPRISADLKNRAADDGMVIGLEEAGRVLGELERDGYLQRDPKFKNGLWELTK